MTLVKKLLLDSLYVAVGGYIILHILEFIKPGLVSNYVDLNTVIIYVIIYIIIATILSQIKKTN